MNKAKAKQIKKARRVKKIRATISGTLSRPRLSVFRSNFYIYAQLIDDTKGQTLLAADSREIKADKKKTKTDMARATGELLATKAKEKKIVSVVFDRRGYQYHGRVKALAEGARSGGLQF